MRASLTKEDVGNIDKWLKRKGFKYIDVRYELLDHLVSEYEQIDNYPDLESFLKQRLRWCKKVEKEKQKTVNFGTTKALFKKLISLFTNLRSLVLLISIGLLFYYLGQSISTKIFKNILLSIYMCTIAYQLYLMMFSGFGNKLKKEALSVSYLINIFSLPQLPMYFTGMFPDTLLQNSNFCFAYLGFGILLSISAILFFYERRKVLLNEFEVLKQQCV